MADFSNSFYQRFCLCFIFVLYQHSLGNDGNGEGNTWQRQNDNVSLDGAQPDLLNAIDVLGKWFYDRTGKRLVVTAGTNGKHADGEHSHAAGWKVDVNDWEGDHIDVALDGTQWDGSTETNNFGGFTRWRESPKRQAVQLSQQEEQSQPTPPAQPQPKIKEQKIETELENPLLNNDNLKGRMINYLQSLESTPENNDFRFEIGKAWDDGNHEKVR